MAKSKKKPRQPVQVPPNKFEIKKNSAKRSLSSTKFRKPGGILDLRIKDSKGGAAARKAKLYNDIRITEESAKLTHKGQSLDTLKIEKSLICKLQLLIS